MPCPITRAEADSVYRSHSVVMGIATIMRYRMTFSHFLKTLFVPLRQGDERSGGGMMKRKTASKREQMNFLPPILSPPYRGIEVVLNYKQ